MARSRDVSTLPREAVLAVRALLVLVAATIVIGGVAVTRLLLEERRARAVLSARLAEIEIGWSEQQVRAVAGVFDTACEGDGGLLERAPESSFFYVDRALVRRLARKTTRRLIYTVDANREEVAKTCVPGYGDAELGFGPDGRLLWYVLFTDESYLVAE